MTSSEDDCWPKSSSGPKLNGFSCFMRTRRPALEAEGHIFPGGWKDVATFLQDEWAVSLFFVLNNCSIK